jgi:ribosomal protein uL22
MADKLEARAEKLKEKFEEKAKQREEEKLTTEAVEKKEEPKEVKKEKPKPAVKKPVVTEATARAVYLTISPKESVEVCRAIRGKMAKKAVAYLERVMELKQAVPYLRYNKEVPHRAGKIAAGRYPKKTARHILDVLKGAIANAKYLNLNEDMLYVKIIKCDRAIPKERQGRYSNIEITVAEAPTGKRPSAETLKTEKPKAKVAKKAEGAG